jgi:hypothetical protein
MFKLTFSFTTEPEQIAVDHATAAVTAMLMYKFARELPQEAQEFASHWVNIEESTATNYLEKSIELLNHQYRTNYIQKQINKVARQLDGIL